MTLATSRFKKATRHLNQMAAPSKSCNCKKSPSGEISSKESRVPGRGLCATRVPGPNLGSYTETEVSAAWHGRHA